MERLLKPLHGWPKSLIVVHDATKIVFIATAAQAGLNNRVLLSIVVPEK